MARKAVSVHQWAFIVWLALQVRACFVTGGSLLTILIYGVISGFWLWLLALVVECMVIPFLRHFRGWWKEQDQ